MKTILITGAKGMFGTDAVEFFVKNGYKVIAADIEDFDITNKCSIDKFFADKNIDIVLHAAAYTNVDKAEEEAEKALIINGKGTENIAKKTAELDIPVIFISTDYVFDGSKNSPYLTSDEPKPINVYGLSKLVGEDAVQKFNDKHYICRTSWLYGIHGKNFIETMINLSQKNSKIKVVNDQISCPTWTIDLAKGILDILQQNKPYGIYHVCGNENISKYEFVQKIFEIENIKTKIDPCLSIEFPTPAKRPSDSAMECGQFCTDWKESLKTYLNLRK